MASSLPSIVSLLRTPYGSSWCYLTCPAGSEMTATMSPSSFASCQMAALNTWGSQRAMLSKWLCTQMAQQPLLGDLTPPGYWVDPDEIWIPHSSEVKAMGSSQGGSIFQLKNPWETCSKLILSESWGNEFVQRRERFSNQECVNNWPRHDQVSLK